jgi:sterol desaturase/sphingolipid hydroxylase (fatty acid hydroxylase superfamily)
MAQDRLFVSNQDESPRIFKNPFLDLVSRVHWSLPLMVWVPVVLFCLYYSFVMQNISTPIGILYFVVAFLLWTLAEYILHRFIFHYHPTSKIGQRIHFVAHGIHHDYPNDSKRLVMPPLMSMVIAIPFIIFFYYTIPTYNWVFFAGFVAGYLVYDMMHYALHHAELPEFMRKLKENHMRHHYQEPDLGFGVSTTFWDTIFGTRLDNK